MKLIYNGDLKPYKRPLYYRDAKVRRKKSVMLDTEVVDYQKKVLNAFQIHIWRENKVALFPVCEKTLVGLQIVVYSPSPTSLIANIKSICDALNKYAYANDRRVARIKAEQKYSNESYIKIKLFTFDSVMRKYRKVCSFKVDRVIPLEKIFPIKRSVLYNCEKNRDNIRNKKEISNQISAQYGNKPQRNINLSMKLFVNSGKRHSADIDNIALTLLNGMKNIVFNSFKDIKSLEISLKETTLNDYAEIIATYKVQRHGK